MSDILWRSAKKDGCGPGAHPHGQASGAPRTERRRVRRDTIRRPLVCMPVLPDGRPDPDGHMIGRTIDWSGGGIRLEFAEDEWRPAHDLMVGVQDPEGTMHFAGVSVRHKDVSPATRIHVGCQFGGVGQELLQADLLSPAFDSESMSFLPRFSEEVLDAWCAAGVLKGYLADRVQVCPRCHGLPSFRPGCRQCGAADVGNDQLIHHYACAHVGVVGDFETPAGLVCPKCRTRHLVINSDFEYLTGPYRCRRCQWSDMELEQVAQCLRCSLRFPAHQAHVQDIRGYHVERLDLLALGEASR